jgi:hypothetical protein
MSHDYSSQVWLLGTYPYFRAILVKVEFWLQPWKCLKHFISHSLLKSGLSLQWKLLLFVSKKEKKQKKNWYAKESFSMSYLLEVASICLTKICYFPTVLIP